MVVVIKKFFQLSGIGLVGIGIWLLVDTEKASVFADTSCSGNLGKLNIAEKPLVKRYIIDTFQKFEEERKSLADFTDALDTTLKGISNESMRDEIATANAGRYRSLRDVAIDVYNK